MKRKLLIGLSIFVILLALTNPTPSDFNTFLEARKLHVKLSSGRRYNFLLFSIYTRNYAAVLPYLSRSNRDSLIDRANQMHREDSIDTETPEQYEQKLKQYEHDRANRIKKLKGYKSYDELYIAVAANKPDLTKEQFATDMHDGQKSYVLYNNIKASKTPNIVPSSYGDFVYFYEFNKPQPPSMSKRQQISQPHHIIYDTTYNQTDTSKSYIGILKNFF